MLIGGSALDFNREIKGSIGDKSIDLLSTPYEDNGAFTWGIGLKGKAADLPKGALLSYDVRVSGFDSNSSGESKLLPNNCGIKLGNESDVDYGEWSISLIASKEIEVGKAVKTFTPYIGFRYTGVDLNVDSRTRICSHLSLASEQNYRAYLASGISGFTLNINDNVDVTAGGVFGDEMGFMGKVTARF